MQRRIIPKEIKDGVLAKAKIEADRIVAEFKSEKKPDLTAQMMYLYKQNLTMQASWDNFRSTNWIEILPYPELTLQQTQEILTLSS